MIPGSGRSAGEGTGYPLQHIQVSLVARLGKNPPAMQETWVQSLRREWLPIQYSGLENSKDCIVHGVAEWDMTERLSLSLH